jgi:hypothetical protein
MTFIYYITDLFDGAVFGTDSEADAEQFAASEDHFVVDSSTGEWMTPSGRLPVKAVGESYEGGEEPDDESD